MHRATLKTIISRGKTERPVLRILYDCRYTQRVVEGGTLGAVVRVLSCVMMSHRMAAEAA